MPKCYVHLGKHGDLIILLAGWYREYRLTGKKPVVMVAREFASTLMGVSYVEPWIVDLHWYGDCGKARVMAEQRFGKANVIFPKWWDDPTFTPPAIRQDATSLIIHGKRMKVETGEWFSYMASQWKYAGFPTETLFDRPVFDRRDAAREELQAQMVFRTSKPKLLMCLNTGGSSPFPYVPELERIIYEQQRAYEIIDLMKVRLHYLFDLLGVFERSAKLITTDTAILHLVGASPLPYFAYLADGGGGSIPRGRCAYSVRYANTLKQLDQLKKYLA